MKYIVYYYRFGDIKGIPRGKEMKSFGSREDAEEFITSYLHKHWLEGPHAELWRQCADGSYSMDYYNEGKGERLQLACD